MRLLAIILAFLTLPNGRHYVRECRQLNGGCEQYALNLEHAITGAAIAHDVDPRMLLAVAYHESSLAGRSNAVSAGVWGFHRRSVLWRMAKRECGWRLSRDDPCLDVQADIAASHLRELLLRCGSWDGALSAYQSGKCRSDSGVRYAARIVQIAGAM